MNNRIGKLMKEESNLLKQIGIAEKHAEFADHVAMRRSTEYQLKEEHKFNLEAHRESLAVKN